MHPLVAKHHLADPRPVDGHRQIALTRTEFSILECLVRASGRVVPRDSLIEEVWGDRDVIWVDGHSDYGHAFEVFFERYGKDINSKTTVLLLGDARNNYHASQAWVVKEIRQKARKVFWLNPEPNSYWNTGDSIVGEYGVHCDGVFECRNLRQLERFVDHLV